MFIRYKRNRFSFSCSLGALCSGPKRTKLDKLFSDKEAIFYKSNKDLNKKLNLMIKDDKKRINLAKKGRLKYHKKFNSILVADYIICKTFNIKKKFNW